MLVRQFKYAHCELFRVRPDLTYLGTGHHFHDRRDCTA
jgi:hypothetical protein